MKSLKKMLRELGYGVEIRRVERADGFGMTHIRQFKSEGLIARLARAMECVLF